MEDLADLQKRRGRGKAKKPAAKKKGGNGRKKTTKAAAKKGNVIIDPVDAVESTLSTSQAATEPDTMTGKSGMYKLICEWQELRNDWSIYLL